MEHRLHRYDITAGGVLPGRHGRQAEVKKILMIATGGTIASMDSGSGLTPVITSAQILDAVPEVRNICDVDAVQLMNLDSSCMTPERWLEMSRFVRQHYDRYDGFVITHGTDTMAYTAAALSYLIQRSPKPVVLTGSQKSIFLRDTDARINLIDSFSYAADPGSAGVSIVFGGRAIIGTRARKERTKSFNAFSSVDYPDLAVIRDRRVIRYFPEPEVQDGPVFYDTLGGRILPLTLVPGMAPDVLLSCRDLYDGVVLQAFGTGGIPNGEEGALAKALREWTGSGKVVVVMTQVPYEGSDMEVYEVGQAVKNRLNLMEAYSMTLEAVITKLHWILGQTKDMQEIRRLFYTEIRRDLIRN